ncbi:MAG: mobilization protein [Pseudomonadales bacterium]
MAGTRLDNLTAKRDQINAQIQAMRSRENSQKRKEDTKRKILIGGTMLKMVRSGEMAEAELRAMLDANLSREKDRELFGLPAKSGLATAGA